MTRRTITAVAGCLSLTLLAGCGATVAGTDAGTGATAASVDVPRCGETVTYTDPQRVIAYEAGSADKLFALGLGDRMLGYVMTPTNPDPATSPYAAEYAKTELLSDQLLSLEVVMDNSADLVVAGWNSGFSEKRGITPQILDGLGVQSFMHTESCFRYPGYPEHVRPMEGLYTDLERLGAIFGVEDRAAEVVSGLRGRMEAVAAGVPAGAERPRVFLYDSGTDQASTAGNQVPVDEIISAAGGENVFHGLDERWTSVGWEAVVEANPEVIMVMDYRDASAESKIATLKNNPALAEVEAIKHDRFYVIDYNECISGPRNVDGAEKFAAWLAKHRP